MVEKLIFKIKGEVKTILPLDKTFITIEDKDNQTTCTLIIKQKVTGDTILRAYNVEYWYIDTVGTRKR
jgi:hypothetical protein